MNLFDLTVILLAVLNGSAGFREGLVRGLLELAGFVLVLIALVAFAGDIARWGTRIPFFPDTVAVPLLFVMLLAAGLVACAVIGTVVSKVIHLTPLGFVDSGFGVAFGVLKAILVAGVLALVLEHLPADGFLHRQYDASRTAQGCAAFVRTVVPAASSAGFRIMHALPRSPSPEATTPRQPSR